MSGPPTRAVGIPGTFCSPRVFAPLVDALDRGDQRVDLSASSWMDGPGAWDIPTVARRIADDISDEGDGAVVLVGHSTGGAIALQLALTAPSLVAGLVLVDTGPNMSEHGDVEAILRTIRDDTSGTVRASILDRSFAAPLAPSVRDELLAYARGVDPRAAIEALSSQRELDFLPLLDALTCPVAVVHGTKDPVRTVAQARAFAERLPGAGLTLLDCGHTPPYEAPEELAAVIRRISRERNRAPA